MFYVILLIIKITIGFSEVQESEVDAPMDLRIWVNNFGILR